ncbi:MAG: TolC family protein [Deltaproteobacteria bacterium]|nr:TolC family protein [Deltaproteobacteria bacterium]
MRVPLRLLLIVSLLSPLSLARAEAPVEREVLLPEADALARAVLAANPELSALESEVAAARSMAGGAGLWMDPMVGAEYSNMAFARPYPGGHAMSGVQLKLQQTLPFPGKLAARRAAADAKIEVAAASLPERQNLLVGEVRALWVRLGLVRQLRKITRSHIELLAQLTEIASVRAEVGQASPIELQRLTLLGDRLEDDLEDFDRDEALLLARLDALLHRAPGEAVWSLSEYPALPSPPALEALVEEAIARDPTLRRLAAAAASEQAERRAARTERKPDVTAWAGYRFRAPVSGGDPGEDFFSVGASIPLPWLWNDRRHGAREARHAANARSLGARLESRQDQLRGALANAHARLVRAATKATRYREKLVPEAHAVLDATLAVYPTGKVGFESVFQAELQLLEFERTLRRTEAEGWLAQTELETLTAENLRLVETK